MNLENPDIEAGCDLDYVPNKAHHYSPADIPKVIISDNLGFGESLLSLFLLCCMLVMFIIRWSQCSFSIQKVSIK